MAQQKKSRKHDRNRNRPSCKVYTTAKRWIANKAKAIKRHTRRMAKKEIRRLMRLAPSMRDNARLVELRQIVSQNLTG